MCKIWVPRFPDTKGIFKKHLIHFLSKKETHELIRIRLFRQMDIKKLRELKPPALFF